MRREPRRERLEHGWGVALSPDVLVAMDVDAVELVLQVLVFHVGHVVDHLQDDEAGQHGQHEPLLGQSNEEGQSVRPATEAGGTVGKPWAEFPEKWLFHPISEHDQCLWTTCCLPGTALGVGCAVMSHRDTCPTPVGLTSQKGYGWMGG